MCVEIKNCKSPIINTVKRSQPSPEQLKTIIDEVIKNIDWRGIKC